MNERTCSVDGCDREFDAKGYCSKHYARWRRYGSPMGPGCKICGAEAAEGRSAYCSDACAALGAEAIWRRSWEKAKGSPERKAQVAAASRRHYERIRGDEALWRDRLNATAEWRKRNAERLAEQNLAWRRANADKVRAKNQRRRSRTLEAFIEDVDPQVVWQRDGGVCQLCGQAIDPTLSWPDKWSKTIDHIVPLSLGGTHEYANTQLAHAVCNARKNDRPA